MREKDGDAQSDILVPIFVRREGRFRIVKVHAAQVFEAYLNIEICH